MDRRIFGLETVWRRVHLGEARRPPDEVARYLFRRVVTWGRSSNVFLRVMAPDLPRCRLASGVRDGRM